MIINNNNNLNNNYANTAFKSKNSKKIVQSLLNNCSGEFKQKATSGHLNNVFFKTDLNNVLRHPEAQIIDQLQYLAARNMHNTLNSGIGQYYIKAPIKENPEILRQKLNEEFKLLPKLTKKQKFYRGIENISDNEYNTFKCYKKGQTVCPDKGYSYITDSLEEASQYNRQRNGILFEIEMPEGSQISELRAILPSKSGFPEFKNEAVVPAGYLYEVLQDPYTDKNGILHIILKSLNTWK